MADEPHHESPREPGDDERKDPPVPLELDDAPLADTPQPESAPNDMPRTE